MLTIESHESLLAKKPNVPPASEQVFLISLLTEVELNVVFSLLLEVPMVEEPIFELLFPLFTFTTEPPLPTSPEQEPVYVTNLLASNVEKCVLK